MLVGAALTRVRGQMDGDLQVEQNLGFQRWMWRVERVGWGLMAVVVAAALTGLFGPGPLSHSTVTSDDGLLTVDFLRFARAGGTSELSVSLDASLAREGQVAVVLDRPFLDSVQIEQISPEPASQVVAPDGVRFAFDTAATQGRLALSYAFRPDAMGSVQAVVAVPDGPQVSVPQFYYP